MTGVTVSCWDHNVVASNAFMVLYPLVAIANVILVAYLDLATGKAHHSFSNHPRK